MLPLVPLRHRPLVLDSRGWKGATVPVKVTWASPPFPSVDWLAGLKLVAILPPENVPQGRAFAPTFTWPIPQAIETGVLSMV